MKKLILLSILTLIAAPSLTAQTFVLVSFNTLHYGWGTNTPNKDQAIYDVAQATGASAIVLQEIMPQANFGNLQTLFPPSTADFMVSQNSFGTGNYQERYLTILARSKFTVLARAEFPALAAPGGPFSRPPMLLQVRPAGSAGTYYIGDFHAVWGRSQSQRTAEAAAICTSLLPLVGSANIALAGDWNLTAAQVTANGTCISNATPAGLTTLNRAGTQYSSSYDHAVTFTGGQLGISASAVYGPANTQTWRANVSDHVPVYVTYTYQ